MSKNRFSGFTLIELLVVVAIIGILSAVVLASLGTARNRARDSSVQASLSSARAQAEIFYSAGNTYSGACAAAAASNGLIGLLNSADTNNAIDTAAPVTAAATAGAWNQVTCHDSASAWAAEAPMSTSVSSGPRMWCVDSTGFSGPLNSVLASNETDCD